MLIQRRIYTHLAYIVEHILTLGARRVLQLAPGTAYVKLSENGKPIYNVTFLHYLHYIEY